MTKKNDIPPIPEPEQDTGYYEGLSAHRRDYRIATNGVAVAIKARVLWLFWRHVTLAPDLLWAERWVRNQMRQRRLYAGPWRVL